MVDELTREIGRLLRDERERAGLSQQAFAARAGVTQQWLSRVERGATAPTTAAVHRLFAVLGLRLRAEPAPAEADLDAQIDALAAPPDERRAAALDAHSFVLRKFADLPYVLSGRLAAYLQGAPVPADRLDIALAEADLDGLAGVLGRVGCLRWNERWRDYLDHSIDPRQPGPLRWRIGLTELGVDLLPDRPAAVTVLIGGRAVPVRPLVDLMAGDAELAAVMARVRERAAGPRPEAAARPGVG